MLLFTWTFRFTRFALRLANNFILHWKSFSFFALLPLARLNCRFYHDLFEKTVFWSFLLNPVNYLFVSSSVSLYSVFNDHCPSLKGLWWAQVDSNHRPRAYQARALTCWAMSPFVSARRYASRSHFWWRWGESNPWPPACRAGALPAELHPLVWGFIPFFRQSLKIEQ